MSSPSLHTWHLSMNVFYDDPYNIHLDGYLLYT